MTIVTNGCLVRPDELGALLRNSPLVGTLTEGSFQGLVDYVANALLHACGRWARAERWKEIAWRRYSFTLHQSELDCLEADDEEINRTGFRIIIDEHHCPCVALPYTKPGRCLPVTGKILRGNALDDKYWTAKHQVALDFVLGVATIERIVRIMREAEAQMKQIGVVADEKQPGGFKLLTE